MESPSVEAASCHYERRYLIAAAIPRRRKAVTRSPKSPHARIIPVDIVDMSIINALS
jgi:hypothetical protein